MKGVILAGGTGSRLYPLTRVTNKHLLPVGCVPMIFYPIRTLVEAGIRDIMLVTGGNNAGAFLELLGNGRDFGLEHLNYAYQEKPGGIAEALGLARHFVGDENCVVHLGDNILTGSIREHVETLERQRAGGRILLKEVPNPQSYGVAAFYGDGSLNLIIEKPANPPSNLAVIGVYLYDSQVWSMIDRLIPSGRGELEITDVNNAYLDSGSLSFGILEGEWLDAGESHESYSKANEVAWERGLFTQAEGDA